jgi:hypothetical protein
MFKFKPYDLVTMARETGIHDFTTPIFTDEPYEKTGIVMYVTDDYSMVFVWWDGTNVVNSKHSPNELRLFHRS